MMPDLLALDELRALHGPSQLVRIPDQVDVPLTPRAKRLVDTNAFRRLAEISQLGLVRLVYPGATHSRFEHSLGTYRLALLFLQKMATVEGVNEFFDRRTAGCFLVAALLHDIGHWPWCHPVEDLGVDDFPTHEEQAGYWLAQVEVRGLLRDDWELQPNDVLRLLLGQPENRAEQIACSMLSGPVDVDKMDYLSRDSLHAGVPYGRNFDPLRLIGSLCLDETGTRLAITSKGKTAAEMMVFSRYVMFSEVYWHHAVRSATAMLQRAVFSIRKSLDVPAFVISSDASARQLLIDAAVGHDERALLDSLFGPQRRLYKRWWQSGQAGNPELFQSIAYRPYSWLVQLSRCVAERLTECLGQKVLAHEILVDAPPSKLEVQFRVDVCDLRAGTWKPLGSVSPVVEALAKRQFDDFVKQVRVFVHPRLAASARELDPVRTGQIIQEAVVFADTSS